jgi:CBS domain-containing protein
VSGILIDRDVTARGVADRRDPERTAVEEVCTPDPVTIDGLATVEEAKQLMGEHIVHRLPVVDDQGHSLDMLALEDLAASGYIDDHDLRAVLETSARTDWCRSAAVP